LLQYFNAGIPAIASPVGVNGGLIDEGRGLAAVSPAEWLHAYRTIAADPVARRERGAAARTFVAREYSYARWAPEVASILKEAYARG
jgi:glycosyltransferase involved in cell wall biosynthesis